MPVDREYIGSFITDLSDSEHAKAYRILDLLPQSAKLYFWQDGDSNCWHAALMEDQQGSLDSICYGHGEAILKGHALACALFQYRRTLKRKLKNVKKSD